MREAIGGTILFYIILGFLVIYIFFIGIIMNYAGSYRASNYVVTRIEQTEGAAALNTSELCEDLRNRNYHNTLKIACKNVRKGTDPVYEVTTNIKFEIPIINMPWDIDIRNETKAIYGTSCEEFGTDAVIVNCGAIL